MRTRKADERRPVSTPVAAHKQVSAANPRGDETRQRLIDAALRIFGEHGFEGASTRMIAEEAGANLAAIPYYFGGKEGLYRAAAQFIVDRATREVIPVVNKIDEALKKGRLPRHATLGLLHELLDRFSDFVLGSEEADDWSCFVMREQMQPGAAFEILYEGVMRRTSEACANLLALLLRQRQDDPKIMVRALAILGQIVVFRIAQTTALRVLGWKDFSAQRLKLIQSVVSENLDRIAGRSR
ncbi:MAG TPA: CerR family C-terminal domain-containing protein [Candidatus Binataceae bacterium]